MVVGFLLNAGFFPLLPMDEGYGTLDDPVDIHWYNILLIKPGVEFWVIGGVENDESNLSFPQES